jgi:hypothetical protein
MKRTILPITEPVARVCVLLDDLVGKFIAAYRDTLPSFGRYESEIEALNLFKIAIRNIEGVIALAREDLILLPPALAAARACFETAVKAAWLVDADDPFDREARWLVHLASEERYCARVADRLAKLGNDVTDLRDRETKIRDFRLSVETKLPRHTARLKATPDFEKMLTALGGERLYSFYILLSQSAHAEHQATWSYRRGGLGTKKLIGEFIQPADWFFPLRVAFLSFSHACRVFLGRLGGKPEEFLSAETHQMIEDNILRIGNNASVLH